MIVVIALGKFRLTVKMSFGDVCVEGETIGDFKASLAELGVSDENVERMLNSVRDRFQAVSPTTIRISVAPSKPEIADIIEYGSDGTPHLIIPPDRLTAREVIGLMLFAKSPNSISMNEVWKLVADNWKGVGISYVSANLNQMRAFIIKEGVRGSYTYRLSGSGRNWIENELLPKLKTKAS